MRNTFLVGSGGYAHAQADRCCFFALHAPGIACPVEDLDPTTVRDLIDAAPCQRGLKIFQACALGSTHDAFTSEHVIEKCEAVFACWLMAPERRSYNRAKRV